MVDIVSRSAWGTRAPRSRQTVGWGSRSEVKLHYSAGPESRTPRQIQDHHMDGNGWADIGYNLLVDSDGTAYEGRGWTVVGAHAAPRNVAGIGICYIGRDGMTPAAKRTVVELYDMACAKASRTLARRGHRDINSTSCPGTANYQWWKSAAFRAAGGTAEGSDPLIGLKKGDTGEPVKALQELVKFAGHGAALGPTGVDGIYGDGTTEGLRLAREDAGSAAKKG
ncbi:N-acetylmuramoyl-L-alanine amidase [Marinactinospora rubrisoli]|uniref:N-acetylmuramoyl-L-alanine amidase n=1 Tax=Marinactinospora rubrisoli TaxID=2715399 RepID=A0ABW2KFK4_9ACTN